MVNFTPALAAASTMRRALPDWMLRGFSQSTGIFLARK
jgi:hypothetical protein